MKELAERERNWDETVTTNEEIKYDMSENRKGKATASYDVMYVHITRKHIKTRKLHTLEHRYDVDDDVNEDNNLHDVLVVRSV